MTDEQYIDAIGRGHFLYWDMLGNLRGMTNHREGNLRWLSGEIYYNYYCDADTVESVVQRMISNEIPRNLSFFTTSNAASPVELFQSTGLFSEAIITTGMAHELLDTDLPKPDKRLNLFRVREITQLSMAGSILNTVFEYRLFSFAHFTEMMENTGQFFYLAEYDGLPVGACMAQHGDCFVNITWVGVLPGYRKLGIAGYLIQLAERDGIQQAKTIGTLHAFPEAIGAYQRVGYRPYCMSKSLELKN